MDMNKEKEAFEAWAKNKGKYVQLSSDGSYVSMTLNQEFEAWQAAKASAVPDGFKIVSFKQISELVVAVNKVDLMTHTEQKTNEVRLAWQDIASKLQAMIEAAQEQDQ